MIPENPKTPHPATRDRSSLFVWQWPADTNEAVLGALQVLAAGNDMLLAEHDRLDAAATAWRAMPDSMLLLVVPAAHKVLAAGMTSGETPSSLLASWMSRARDVLDLRSTDRRRCLLVTPEAAVSQPADLCALLSLKPVARSRTSDLPENDPVLEILAKHALDSDAETRSIVRELNASLLHLDHETAGSTLDAALRHYSRSREIEVLTEQLLAAQQEAETNYQRAEGLEAARDAALTETEVFMTELTAAGAQVEQLEQQKNQLYQGLESHQAMLQEAEIARQSLREQLAQMFEVHSELENHFARAESLEKTLAEREVSLADARSKAARFERRSQRLEQRVALLDHSLVEHQAHIAHCETHIAALDDRLNRILRSPGYRLTAPLRALLGRSSKEV
ncbi:hypothetical protein [Aestuariicoccus sp. MJ-SS9]|uniref:hypothetical protein n=1 Tax=Aestuariicoccus sp. MJ-SS9 TaxID=3079855 RepID=UPI00290C442B|nr:hypothetical protein [Aestuariicoccus sp. MJ-SS9]MDU8914000.1 hypothetical protein [Aestuariicoccus sp. MJ-SS9]